MKFIVAFPNEWFMRKTSAAGEIGRAERFETEEAARAALKERAKYFKPASRKAAIITPVEE